MGSLGGQGMMKLTLGDPGRGSGEMHGRPMETGLLFVPHSSYLYAWARQAQSKGEAAMISAFALSEVVSVVVNVEDKGPSGFSF